MVQFRDNLTPFSGSEVADASPASELAEAFPDAELGGVYGQSNGQLDSQPNGQPNGQSNGQSNGQLDGQPLGQSSGQLDSQILYAPTRYEPRPSTARSIAPPPTQLIAGLIAAALAVCGLGIFLALRPADPAKSRGTQPSDAPAATPAAPTKPGAVTALGRLEPTGGVLKVAAPSSGMGSTSRVARVLVKEGDKVKQGQPLVIMDSYERLRAEALQAQAQVREAEAQLNQVKAGAKQGDIGAQVAEAQGQIASVRAKEAEVGVKRAEELSRRRAVEGKMQEVQGKIEAARAKEATVKRWEMELEKVQKDFERYQALAQDGAIAATELDSRRLTVQTTAQQLEVGRRELEQAKNDALQAQRQQQQAEADLAQAQLEVVRTIREGQQSLQGLEQAKQEVKSVRQVRPEDIQEAQAGIQVALANFERAKAELANAVVMAPINAQVLKVHTDVGESVANDGILELGRTQQMDVVAEIYETDIGRVRPGQRAVITGPALPRPLMGQVYHVGLQIRKNDVLNTDPAADTDARIVEVKIRLTDSQPVAGLTNLQVNVEIQP